MTSLVAVYLLSSRAASNTTECPLSCANQFRSLPGIVLSCITTIFLCIWVALHLNVPEPVDTRGLNRLCQFRTWIKWFFGCNIVPVVVTLLFPEWVLGIAVLQFTKATQLAKQIGCTRQQGFFIIMGGFHLFKRSQGYQIGSGGGGGGEACSPVRESAVEGGDGRSGHTASNQTINVEEAFGEPVHPLDEFDVWRLIKAGKLLLPTFAELQDKCKSDGLAKFLVIAQTLWFITQCIARKINNLQLTELEVVTLGYTLLTLSMYVAWWDKPYRVTFPVRVYEPLPRRTKEQERLKRKTKGLNFLEMVVGYAIGTQGGHVDLRSVKHVPMFHSGYSGMDDVSNLVAPVTTIIVGMLFGAVHFLAWSSPFPTIHVQYLWRFATMIIAVMPFAAVLGLFFAALIVDQCFGAARLLVLPLLLFPLIYFIGRGITIVIALKTLAGLPIDAYRDMEWSSFFPHI
ncbi:SubName: Full=Uncharacterized protein {ECO:0000313/EMBL:CCA70842.1} [Serendipita indica DSM 11827]|uniref:Uncharacterized protein n=1 Tax=Serendipita indica (strain DSM 11827) TaxID=1109443 RepID=G4THP9_SERID|nr:SubName: Full=Uncharacterized protein {ECO:0000313/EMBL:CCA70842.1} [Serendipita indica DSM 11827]CCA70842.1 hypothetical protein PIIN_04777 [Serendipita indica DSM 11827]